MERPICSVILVNYFSANYCAKAIQSMRSFFPTDVEYIVVDNSNSLDETQKLEETIAGAVLEKMNANTGFSRANNRGISIAKGEFVLLINPDTWVEENCLSTLIQFYHRIKSEGKIGLISCRLRDENGNLLVGSHSNFPSILSLVQQNALIIKSRNLLGLKPISSKLNFESKHQKNHKLSVASGACLFLNRDIIDKEKFKFDEDFFLYYEDTEWSYRLTKRGYQNYFCAEAQVRHLNSATTKKVEGINRQIQLSEWLYFYKTSSRLGFSLFCILLRLNFKLDLTLAKRKKLVEEEKKLIHERAIFLNYSKRIRNEYQRRPNSNRHFLKFENDF